MKVFRRKIDSSLIEKQKFESIDHFLDGKKGERARKDTLLRFLHDFLPGWREKTSVETGSQLIGGGARGFELDLQSNESSACPARPVRAHPVY